MAEQGAKGLSIRFPELGEKHFTSLQDVQQWRESERAFWTFIDKATTQDARQAAGQVRTATSRFFGTLDNYVAQMSNNQSRENFDATLERIRQYVENLDPALSIIFKDSPTGAFISEIASKKPNLAVHVAAHLLRIRPDSNQVESLEGSFLAIAFRHGLKDTTESQRESLLTLHAEWTKTVAEARSTLSQCKIDLDHANEQQSEQQDSQSNSFNDFLELSKQAMEISLATAKEQLADIAKTYDEKLSLHSSVTYWNKKAKQHRRSAWGLSVFALLIGSAFAVGIGYEVFYAVGTMQKLSELPVWKAGMLLLTAITSVWILRVLVRLLLSDFHLYEDARERSTMINTYLAFIRHGEGLDQKQRELILLVLFRPSATGIVRDDALPPAIAQWLNAITNPA